MEIGKIKKAGIVSIIIIFAVIILHYTKIIRPLENILLAAIKPISGGVHNLSQKINSTYYDQRSKQELNEENERLRADLIKTKINESQLKEMQEQNEFLRRQLDFLNERNVKGVVANVIGRNQDTFQNFLIIDKGTAHGLAKGLAVTNKEVVIGKVHEVSKYTSKILLINDSFSKLAVSAQNQDNSIGILSGEYGLGMRIDLIPQTEEITEGDFVITSGLEQGVIRGLYVGQIDSIKYVEGELFKTAFVKSPINFNKINFISVLLVEYDTESP